MSLSVFQRLAGTLLDRFRIGRAGPTLRQGTASPFAEEVIGDNGDLYIQCGATQSFYQKRNGRWSDLSVPAYQRKVVITGTYTVLPSDSYLGINHNGPVDIYLPPGMSSRTLVIKDEGGWCSGDNRIRIFASLNEFIEGDTDMILNLPRSAATLIFGQEWHLI